MHARLERDDANKMIGGVCAGLARYLQLDVTLIRLFFLAALVFGGFGFLAYIVLLVIMPKAGETPSVAGARSGLSDAVQSAADSVRDALGTDTAEAERRRAGAGWILVALGAIFLVSNSGVLRGFDSHLVWPLALVAVGVWLLVRQTSAR